MGRRRRRHSPWPSTTSSPSSLPTEMSWQRRASCKMRAATTRCVRRGRSQAMARIPGRAAARLYSFGLWTVMNRGADPFGAPTRAALDPLDAISGLAAHGAGAFELHAEDLIPADSSAVERDRLIAAARRRLTETGIVCHACGSSLLWGTAFKGGRLVFNHARRPRLGV